MRDITTISRALFDKIRSRFDGISLGDEEAKSTVDPEQARFFNFKFTTRAGKPLTFVTMSLINEDSLRVYFSKSFPEKMTTEEKNEWYEFLRSLRKFAKNNLLTFDPKDIAKSNLDLRDIKQQAKTDSAWTADDFKVNESKMYGTLKKSFLDHGNCRICIEHTEKINPEHKAARSRKINSIFLETTQGERFKLKYNTLDYARAIAEHVTQGGNIYDEIANNINTVTEELLSLQAFVRSTRNFQFEDAEASDMREAAANRLQHLKETLKSLNKTARYREFVENYEPDCILENDVDGLRDKFTKRVYNSRIDAALPWVYTAYKRVQEQRISEELEEFDAWSQEIVEGTWAVPDSETSRNTLDDIMAKPVAAGLDGINAQGVFNNVLGDDDLYDLFKQAGHDDEDTDVRPMVIKWLDNNGYKKLARRYQKNLDSAESEDKKSAAPGTELNTDTEGLKESVDYLTVLAGIKK